MFSTPMPTPPLPHSSRYCFSLLVSSIFAIMADSVKPAEDWSAYIDQLNQHGPHYKPYADTTQRNLEFIMSKWEKKRHPKDDLRSWRLFLYTSRICFLTGFAFSQACRLICATVNLSAMSPNHSINITFTSPLPLPLHGKACGSNGLTD